MEQITLTNTQLAVSRLSFGTSRLHHLRTSCCRQQLLHESVAHGFTHFDTSPYYGDGIAEHELGRFLATSNQNITVATKVGMYPSRPRTHLAANVWARKLIGKFVPNMSKARVNWSVRYARQSLNESLLSLQRDFVDILFLHEPNPNLIRTDEWIKWLEDIKARGKVRYWGVAGSREQFQQWAKSGAKLAHLLQVRDSLNMELDWHSTFGRAPQFTFGYLTATDQVDGVTKTLQKALSRNPMGSVLVSTRKLHRIKQLAIATDNAGICSS